MVAGRRESPVRSWRFHRRSTIHRLNPQAVLYPPARAGQFATVAEIWVEMPHEEAETAAEEHRRADLAIAPGYNPGNGRNNLWDSEDELITRLDQDREEF
jgi:hypothetical protein